MPVPKTTTSTTIPLTFSQLKELITYASINNVSEIKVGDVYIRLLPTFETPKMAPINAQQEHDNLMFMSSSD
jgi:hypothetical protein